MTTDQPRPLADGIPTDTAWRQGDRIYVRCGRDSAIDGQLRTIGATWDRDARALSLPATRADAVTELVRAHLARIASYANIKSRGHSVSIPYSAGDIRTAAKGMGAVWDAATRMWYLPDEQSQQAILARIQEYRTAGDRARAAQQADIAAAHVRRSGRTPTGDTADYVIVSTQRMRRAEADRATIPPGTVVRLTDGRRGVVTATAARFTNSEMASSVCWHPETHDQAHWDLRHTVAIVEPTADELAADAAEQAEQADAAALHAFVQHGRKIIGAMVTDEYGTIPAEDIVATITETYGTEGNRGATIHLTTDGRVIYRHPGWYDSWVLSEGVSTDPDVVAQVQSLVDIGPRVRRLVDQTTYTYAVTTG